MSLIVKGMEMPQAGDIIICGQIDGKLQCTIVTRDKPTKWCEASEVSAPHGRLIDADALLRTEINLANYPSNYVRIAPTIVEAEMN